MNQEKKVPGNTSKQVRENPEGFLATALVMGGDDAIKHQESCGQCSFVQSETLPTNLGRPGSGPDIKTILEAAGVKFLGVVKDDEIFQYVELPSGWKKVATDHSMWSKLVDNKGRERAAIFYKAAFYDRSAHMHLCRRYGVSFDYDRFEKEKVCVADVMDSGKVIYTTKPVPAGDKRSSEASEKSEQLAVEWLTQKYPDWQNPAAYWD